MQSFISMREKISNLSVELRMYNALVIGKTNLRNLNTKYFKFNMHLYFYHFTITLELAESEIHTQSRYKRKK